MNPLVEQNAAAVDQGLELIDALKRSGGAVETARIAPHFRHCIDFYSCFFSGVAGGRVDYDARTRSPELESDLDHIRQALVEIRERLETLDDSSLDTALKARADAIENDSPWTSSTAGRELLFLLSHTIHHWALIDLLLREDGFEAPPEFGMASSTLKQLERQPECAR